MEIPETTKSEKRLIMTLGRHQTEDEPLIMSELCEQIGEPLQALQRGKPGMIADGFVEEERDHPSTYLKLTEEGENLYEALEKYAEVILDGRED